MNRILKNHLKKFVTENGLDFLNESDKFERFVNYSVLANAVVSTIDLDEITTDSGEDGIDGIAIIVNEKIIISVEEAVQIFLSKIEIMMLRLCLYKQKLLKNLI